MKILIKNGRVMDPASSLDKKADVAIAGGRIVSIGKVPADFTPAKTIDATGCIVAQIGRAPSELSHPRLSRMPSSA